MEEFFIECVRQYPCIWDTKLTSYKQLDVKDKAWKEILKKTNIASVSLAKLKWKHLRDTHREKLKKICKTTTGQSQQKIKPWKYMSHMEFLLPYMTNTERETNVSPHPDILTSLDETDSIEESRDYSLLETSTKKTKTDEVIHDEEESLLNFLKEINDNRVKRTAQRDDLRKGILTSSDPLKAFFDSMYQSTKQMPEHYQRSIKRKLFQSVMDAEENIANNTTYYSHNYDYHTPTIQTNYGSEHGSIYSPQPSVSGVQQTKIEKNTIPYQETVILDSMLATETTPSDGTNNN